MSRKQLYASRLQKGDTIAIVSPSGCGAGLFSHRVKRGIKNLERRGYRVVFGKNAFKVTGYTAGSPQERAEDINQLFRDKAVKAIVCAIGGNHSNQLLPHLDWKAIKDNPKIFCGFSDITVLHLAIHKKTGLITFYGPSFLNQFSEYPTIHRYTWEYFCKAVASPSPIGKITPSSWWTDEVLDWAEKKDSQRPRRKKKNRGWIWLRSGRACGRLIGGCITSLMHLRGTSYFPSFKNALFFWEIPEGESIYEGEPVSVIDSYLTDLELSGVFEKIKGMIVGRPYRYNKRQVKDLVEVIKTRTSGYNFPILFNVDFGHTDPIITLPIGVRGTLDSQQDLFSIDGKAVC